MGLVDQVRGSAIAPSNLVLLNHFRKRCVEIQSEQPTYSETSSSERKSPTVEPWKHILHRRLPQRPEIIRFCELSFLSDCLQLKEGSTDTHSFSSGYARNRSLAVAILAQATGSVACRMHDLKAHAHVMCATLGASTFHFGYSFFCTAFVAVLVGCHASTHCSADGSISSRSH